MAVGSGKAVVQALEMLERAGVAAEEEKMAAVGPASELQVHWKAVALLHVRLEYLSAVLRCLVNCCGSVS